MASDSTVVTETTATKRVRKKKTAEIPQTESMPAPAAASTPAPNPAPEAAPVSVLIPPEVSAGDQSVARTDATPADDSLPANETATPESTGTPLPTVTIIQQLRKRLMRPEHTVHYQTRQKQLQTTLQIMEQIARKIGKEDAPQRAVLAGLYELLLVIAERFVLLTHGIMQLDVMNHATALPAIREARKRFKQVADLQSQRQQQEYLDVPGTLKLLAELSRTNLD